MYLFANFLNLVISLRDPLIPIIKVKHVISFTFLLSLKQWHFEPGLHKLVNHLHIVLRLLHSLLKIVNHLPSLFYVIPGTYKESYSAITFVSQKHIPCMNILYPYV